MKNSATRRWLDDMKYHQCGSSHQEKFPDDGEWTIGYKCGGCGRRFSILKVEFDSNSIGSLHQSKLLSSAMKTQFGRITLGIALSRNPILNHAVGF